METKDKKPGWLDSPRVFHVALALLFLGAGAVFLAFGVTPTHDVIGAYGVTHFFLDSMRRGVVPFWNPYSETGTPFFPYWQQFGLADPSGLLFVLVQRVSGCGSLAVFLFRYLFQYFVFVVGAYHAFRALTRDHRAAALFSLFLLLATFPSVMHQGAALQPFYLWPFITWAFFRLFEAPAARQGPWFFAVSCLCASACLSFIPSYLIFYLLFFALFALLLGLADVRGAAAAAQGRSGRAWLALSALTAGLIAAPVVALAFEMRGPGELLPLCRIMLHNGMRLPAAFSSDFAASGVFSEKMETWVSITKGNLLGLLLQPERQVLGFDLWGSDISLYAGFLPLFCALRLACRPKAEARGGVLMLLMSAALLLVMCSFGGAYDRGLAQRILVAVVPGLRKIETFEAFGTPFLFCLLGAGAAGYARARRRAGAAFWAVPAAAAAAKLLWACVTAPLSPQSFRLGPFRIFPAAVLSFAALFAAGWCCVDRPGAAAPKRVDKLRAACVVLAFFDLLWFDLAHVQAFDHASLGESAVVETGVYDALRAAGELPPRSERGFSDRRKPFIESCIYGLIGRELLSGTKAAMPAVLNRFSSGCADIDDTFATRRYYDYLVHVPLRKQLVLSGVTSPILNFFPKRAAVLVKGERAAIAAAGAAGEERLAHTVIIEDPRSPDFIGRTPGPPGQAAFLTASKPEALALLRAAPREAAYSGFDARVTAYDANRLSLDVTAPEGGYLFYGDGYSPHWKARVDGRPAAIAKADVNFKAVWLEKGRHRVDFVYDPAVIRWGLIAGVWGDALALAVLLLWRLRFSRR